MKTVYLITIPSDQPNGKPYQFVTDNLINVAHKYSFYMVQEVEFVKVED